MGFRVSGLGVQRLGGLGLGIEGFEFQGFQAFAWTHVEAWPFVFEVRSRSDS